VEISRGGGAGRSSADSGLLTELSKKKLIRLGRDSTNVTSGESLWEGNSAGEKLAGRGSRSGENRPGRRKKKMRGGKLTIFYEKYPDVSNDSLVFLQGGTTRAAGKRMGNGKTKHGTQAE